jgi:ribose transport system substrate-binding protein
MPFVDRLAPRRSALVAGLIAVCLTVAACGDADDGGSTGASTGAGGAATASADVAAARKALEPFTGHPTAFPVKEPLVKPLPAGTKYTVVQCASPVCSLLTGVVEPAVKAIGAELNVVKAPASASATQNAVESAIAAKPDGVILIGMTPEVIAPQLRELKDAGIPTASLGIIDAEKYGIGFDSTSVAGVSNSGARLADWVVVKKGDDADIVFYKTPELSFMQPELDGFRSELEKVCPSCKLREVVLPITTIGSTAPSRVVSDLQSHPDTNVAVFGTEEAATGLPAALKTAGIDVLVTGYVPTPANLVDIKADKIGSGLAGDLAVGAWTTVDALARQTLGQPISDYEKHTPAPQQLLEAKDITFDPSKGWSGYPDFAERFAKLWKVG